MCFCVKQMKIKLHFSFHMQHNTSNVQVMIWHVMTRWILTNFLNVWRRTANFCQFPVCLYDMTWQMWFFCAPKLQFDWTWAIKCVFNGNNGPKCVPRDLKWANIKMEQQELLLAKGVKYFTKAWNEHSIDWTSVLLHIPERNQTSNIYNKHKSADESCMTRKF